MRRILPIILIFFIIIIILVIKKGARVNTKYIKSDIDGQSYLVKDLKDAQQAANMIARVKKNIVDFTNYLNKNKEEDDFKEYKEYIEQLVNNIKNVSMSENTDNDMYTSYSVNKGEEMVLCLRSKQGTGIHDLNLIMYVVLHEMAHVACPEYGHTELFKKIFAFFTERAIKIGLYEHLNFNSVPIEYCGITITDSII